MFEHYENYDRYIPDVMLKKHKKHEEYLNNAYAGMTHEEIYKSKLGTVEDAIGLIDSGDCIVWSIHASEPRLFLRNLHRIADRIDPNNPVELWSCVHRWGPEYPVHTDTSYKDKFHHQTFFYDGNFRKIHPSGMSTYFPVNLHNYGQELHRCKRPNVVVVGVSPMDEHGFFNFGPNASHLAAVCETSRTVIVEVNENMPVCLGGFENGVHISNVDMIVEGSNPTIAEMGGAAAATDVDEAVAKLIVDEIPDGACLQLGIGGMPNAVGSLIAKSDLKDLGVHTEMYVDAFVDIAAAGKITGAHKALDKGRQVYAFGAGTKKLYDYLNNNPACMSAPVDYTNDVRTIAALDNFMSINNAVDLDLFGQVNAESAGIKHISGAGGQLDFVLGAYLSKGGKSFICCSSTFKNKAGELQSRILPTLNQGSIVTDTRANLHYLVTEYGKVNLKGLATWQKCEAIISVAHPQFRDQLIKEAEKMHIWRASNKR